MATTLRDFLIKLGVDADEKKLKDFDDRLERVKSTALGVVRVMAKAVTGAAALGAGLVANAVTVGKYADEVDRVARSVGLTTDEIQELGFAFERVDGDIFDVADVLNTLSDRAEDARSGMKSFQEDFELVGLTTQDLKADDPEELFFRFADAIASTKDQSKGAVAAVRLLGDDVGNRLLPLLREGRAGFERLAAEANALGVVMSKRQIDAAKEFRNQWRRILSLLTSLRNQLALAVIPRLTEAAERTLDWFTANRKWVEARIGDAVEKLGDIWDGLLERLTKINNFVNNNLGGWASVIGSIASALAGAGIIAIFVKLWNVIQLVTTAFGILSSALGGAALIEVIIVIGGVIAQFAILYFVIDDILTFFRGGDSLTGRFLEWGRTSDGVIGSIFGFLDSLFGLLKEIALFVADSLAGSWEALKIIAEPIIDAIMSKLGEVKDFLAEELKPVIDLISMDFEGWGNIFDAAAGKLRKLRTEGGLEEQKISNARGTADEIRNFFGGAQAEKQTAGTREANRNIANSMSSGDTNVTVHGAGGDPDEVAEKVAKEMEERDRERRRQAMAVFEGGKR